MIVQNIDEDEGDVFFIKKKNGDVFRKMVNWGNLAPRWVVRVAALEAAPHLTILLADQIF